MIATQREDLLRGCGPRGRLGVALSSVNARHRTEVSLGAIYRRDGATSVSIATGTLQDRLVKELRLRGISSLAAANAYAGDRAKAGAD